MQTALALAENEAQEDSLELVTISEKHMRAVVKISSGFRDFIKTSAPSMEGSTSSPARRQTPRESTRMRERATGLDIRSRFVFNFLGFIETFLHFSSFRLGHAVCCSIQYEIMTLMI
uniref:AAA+ ATPase lid domain-containing protein n=1 Tax=Bionectria ochroleuca TaxID=29856 RepID=A0A8H7TN25_BIOOC